MKFFSLEFIARVLVDRLQLASSATDDMLLDALRLYGGDDDLHATTIPDKTEIDGLKFELTYGAENAVARSKTLTFSRKDIAARILSRHEEHIREKALATVGVWRADLIQRIRESLPTENDH